MSDLKLGALIEGSFSWTKVVLFKPFSGGKWGRFLLIGFLAGAFEFGGATQALRLPRGSDTARTGSTTLSAGAGGGATDSAGKGVQVQEENAKQALLKGLDRFSWDKVTAWLMDHKGWLATGAAGLLLFYLFWAWVSARFTFVWFNAVRENSSEISGPFDAFAGPAQSLFKLYAALAAGSLLYIAGIGAWAFRIAPKLGALKADGTWSLWSMAAPLLPLMAVLGLSVLVMGLFTFFLNEVVVTVMAMDHCGVREGFGKALGVVRGRLPAFGLFLLVWIGLKLAAGLAMSIVRVVVMLVLGLAALLAGGLLYLLLVKIIGLKGLFAAVALLLGVPAVAAMLAIILAVHLPVSVFFRALSMRFMSALDCGYAPLPLESEEKL